MNPTDSAPKQTPFAIPSYLNKKGNVVRLTVFTAVFALLFLNLYQPFNSGIWAGRFGREADSFVYFFYSSLVTLAGMCVIAISRILLYYYAKKHTVTYFGYAGFILLEIAVMGIIFSLFTVFVLERFNKIDVPIRLARSFLSAIKKTSLVLLIPYTIMWLYFALKDKTNQLIQLREKHNQSESEREKERTKPRNEMVCFYDEKGDLRLSIDKNSLYYIESADNYVKIYYMMKGRLEHFMLRNSMKSLDEQIGDRLMMRCHRSYMVNLDKVKLLRKCEDGLMLDLDNDHIPEIPVSKTYSARVLDKFTSQRQ